METILTLKDLVLPGVEIFANGAEYAQKSFGDLPEYDPSQPNQYWEYDGLNPMFRFDRSAGKIVPLVNANRALANIPDYVPFDPPKGQVFINGKLNEDPWDIAYEDWALELSEVLELPLITYKDKVPSATVTGVGSDQNWYLLVFKNYVLNVGQAWKTRAPFGHHIPGKWDFNQSSLRLQWIPNLAVNPVTTSPPIRDLAPDEELAFSPIGDPVIVKKAAPPPEGGSADISQQLNRIETLLGEILFRLP